MLIKVGGLWEPTNVHRVAKLDIDIIALNFHKTSFRFVKNILSHTGILPDRADTAVREGMKKKSIKVSGVFCDDMPQIIVTQVYNYQLDYVQLNGSEGPIYINNLRRTLVPDIAPEVKFIKSFPIKKQEELTRYKEYEGVVDMFQFNLKSDSIDAKNKFLLQEILTTYTGTTPFLIGCNAYTCDINDIIAVSHPLFAGISLYFKFESEEDLADVKKLKELVKLIRQQEKIKIKIR